MQYKGTKLTLNNYREELSDCSIDVLDVVRSAILDDVQLGAFIQKYKNNPYMLWQVKLGMDEYMDTYWFTLAHSGEELAMLRKYKSRGLNINSLKKYFMLKLPSVYYTYILKWYEQGVQLDKYDFSILPESLLDVFDKGISRGYYMSVFNNGISYEPEYIVLCLRIMSKKKSIVQFLNGDWDIENLRLLSEFSKSKFYDKLDEYVTKEITPSVLSEIIECTKCGMNLEELCIVDDEGIYVYSPYHIKMIREAYMENLDYSVLLDSSLSLTDVNMKFTELSLSSKKKLSGKLYKK